MGQGDSKETTAGGEKGAAPVDTASDSESEDELLTGGGEEENEEEEEEDSESDSDYDYDLEEAGGVGGDAAGGKGEAEAEDDNSPETNVRKFTEALDSAAVKKREQEEERQYVFYEDLFDFPRDPEKWQEEDLEELWADAPLDMTKPGWDPVWADEEDWEVVQEEVNEGRDPPIAPFYLPYRKHFPVIPDNHYDVSNPKSVIEELDRIEEFLKWVSYIFPDGSSYEGTVWDDLAHGKGVYVAEEGLVRYEGEWLQNAMEGHGVVEVEIPGVEPVPGSKLEAKMRAEGKIISRDFMSPDDKKWLEMDIEDSVRLAGGIVEVPFYENDEWVKIFGEKPEKGRYKYAGQWKHGRMHGCGVYEVNEHAIYGRFYFGEHLEDPSDCDADLSALHAGIAEVAAAKARMFVNKPNGMVREDRGPYGDPQHPYFYEEDDVWMAPGFINQFYEVPDYWKTYVQEIDQEREMWLNSFHKSPLRIPMPAELEYWWAKDQSPEFVLINKEPEPDPEDPSKLIYTEDPLILHTLTGRLINFVEDDEYGVRLFWQPPLKEGEDVDPDKVEFLPLGFDELYGRKAPVKKESTLTRLVTVMENAIKPLCDKLEKWTEEKKKASEMNLKLIEKELDFIEAEICLEESIEDMEIELKMKQKEEERRATSGKDGDSSVSVSGDVADADEGEEEDEDEDEGAPSSFGTVSAEEARGSKPGKTAFSSLSMALSSCTLASMVPAKLQDILSSGKKAGKSLVPKVAPPLISEKLLDCLPESVSFPCSFDHQTSLRAVQQRHRLHKRENSCHSLNTLAGMMLSAARPPGRKNCRPKRTLEGLWRSPSEDKDYQFNVLSMHVPVYL